MLAAALLLLLLVLLPLDPTEEEGRVPPASAKRAPSEGRMVLLDALNPQLHPGVVRFVDALVLMHVLVLVYYAVTLAADFATGGKRGKGQLKGE